MTSMQALCYISSAFINDAILLFKRKQQSRSNLSKFLRSFRGHVDTDQFIALERKRFEDMLPVGASLESMIATAFITDINCSRSFNINTTAFIRDLWTFVINRVAIQYNTDETARICEAVNFFVAYELTKFQSSLLSSPMQSNPEPE